MASLVGETGVHANRPSPEELEEQVNRVLSSDVLKASRNLHSLLKFMVAASSEGRAENLKEITIATEVFGRREDFDNRIDTVVRVQAHRLRRKLAKYYAGAGKNDPWIIQIPAGSYVPHFRPKQPAEGRQDQESRRAAGSVISWSGVCYSRVRLGLGLAPLRSASVRFWADFGLAHRLTEFGDATLMSVQQQ